MNKVYKHGNNDINNNNCSKNNDYNFNNKRNAENYSKTLPKMKL